MKMKKIAVINDLSGFGKCSLAAALPIISALGIQACPLVTGVFSNQTGYDSYFSVDLTDYLPSMIDEWKKLNISFDGILTGFIPSSRQGKIICDFIDDFKEEKTVVAVDPVMGDDGKIYDFYDENSIKAMRKLASKADIITPNMTELELLYGGKADIETMARSFDSMVVVTGIELSESEIGNAVFDGSSFEMIKAKRFGGSYSGTGDILVSYILSDYLNNKDIIKAVKKASSFIEQSIEETLKEYEPRGYHPDGVNFESVLMKNARV